MSETATGPTCPDCGKPQEGPVSGFGYWCQDGWQCGKDRPVAPASSGPVALVERLRAEADSFEECQRMQIPWQGDPGWHVPLLREAADAVASASPAPACASCAEKDAEIAELDDLRLRLEVGLRYREIEKEEQRLRAETAAALQQSQAQEIQRKDAALLAIAKTTRKHGYLEFAELAERALKGQE